ncbi:hypothetical protein HYALB_00000428 [Hymenoscyphus albidus]|uniref:Uncharacterized protein n=1 Tax=Hymenoscyphus albidus TaxID=595503 RepID=A0A9N9LM40_9HELO|nr:hypothetical protein HYALB_00000428 [Hymenoscyphus albidus]
MYLWLARAKKGIDLDLKLLVLAPLALQIKRVTRICSGGHDPGYPYIIYPSKEFLLVVLSSETLAGQFTKQHETAAKAFDVNVTLSDKLSGNFRQARFE